MPSTLTLLSYAPVSRLLARRALLLLVPCIWLGCAQGAEVDEFEGYARPDGGLPLVDAGNGVRDSASSALPESSLPPGPVDPGPTTPLDTGVGGGASDSGTTPVDTGTQLPQDTGTPRDTGTDTSVTPPMDAAPDTSTPPRDASNDTGSTTPDTGTTPDANVTPEASTNPNMCSSTPAYPTTTECARCTCMRCAMEVSNCYASNESAKNTQCAAVQACAETNKCVDRDCYCGKDTSDFACLNNQNGACEQVIETAAGSDSALDVQRAGDDPQSPVGRAALIGACQVANCKSVCGL